MVHCDIVLVLYNLKVNRMIIVGVLCLKRRKCYAAACHDSLSCGLDDIAADGTDIEPGLLHVRGPVLVPDVHSGEKLNHGDVQCPGQGLDQSDVWKSPARLPLAHGLCADADFVGKLLLCHPLSLSELLYQ